MDGRSFSNLRFADYIPLFPNSTAEAEAMLVELNEAGKKDRTAKELDEYTVHEERLVRGRSNSIKRLSTQRNVVLVPRRSMIMESE